MEDKPQAIIEKFSILYLQGARGDYEAKLPYFYRVHIIDVHPRGASRVDILAQRVGDKFVIYSGNLIEAEPSSLRIVETEGKVERIMREACYAIARKLGVNTTDISDKTSLSKTIPSKVSP